MRDRVPMTFMTPEPYIGHLGLDGVGDTKSLLESALREKHIRRITNAKVAKVDADMLHVEEMNQDGSLKVKHELAFVFSMLPSAVSKRFGTSMGLPTRVASFWQISTNAIRNIRISFRSAFALQFRW